MTRVAGLAVLLLVAGCRPQKPVERPYAPPRIEDAVAALRAHSAHLTSLRDLSTRVELKQGKQHGKMSVKMLIARGGQLRFEASAPVVGDVAVLVSDGQTGSMNDQRNSQFATGPSQCLIQQLIGIDLLSEEVAAVLLGGAPGLDGKPSRIDWDRTHGGREVLTLDQPNGDQEKLFLDGRDGRWDLLGAERTDGKGALVWRIEHEDWRDVGGGLRLPRRTHVMRPSAEVWIRWKDQEPNVEPPEGVFTLQPPPNIPVTPVTC
jgi:outer membrane lipoprotein-sorting protein